MEARGAIVIALVAAAVVGSPCLAAWAYLDARWRADHPYGEIDGVLWRQVAGSFDPLKDSVFSYDTDGSWAVRPPVQYVEALRAERWDGRDVSAPALGLDDGAAVVYDVAVSETAVSLSAFISSGVRAEGPTDRGYRYDGPSTVYTCLAIQTEFSPGARPAVLFGPEEVACPAVLIEQLADDARYANPDLFDG